MIRITVSQGILSVDCMPKMMIPAPMVDESVRIARSHSQYLKASLWKVLTFASQRGRYYLNESIMSLRGLISSCGISTVCIGRCRAEDNGTSFKE
jgi:hypothetical protein